MWQRFAERARRVVFFAQEEAERRGDKYVSTEHLLLGLVREEDNVASRILEELGIPTGRIRADMERQMAVGDPQTAEDIMLHPRGKRVIDLAHEESRRLQDPHIGTDHLLLGLIREGEGLASRVLTKLGATIDAVRAIVDQQRAPKPPAAKPPSIGELWEAMPPEERLPFQKDQGVPWSQVSPQLRTSISVCLTKKGIFPADNDLVYLSVTDGDNGVKHVRVGVRTVVYSAFTEYPAPPSEGEISDLEPPFKERETPPTTPDGSIDPPNNSH